MRVDVVDSAGEKTRELDLPPAIFGLETNVPLIHQVVVGQLAAARQGTHAVKTRGMVSGGSAKPYRQKGTGRARQGSIRAPQFAGGGTVHGPVPRKYDQRTPKKMKAAALRSALSDRARYGRVHVVTSLFDGEVPSTKTARAGLRAVTTSESLLVVHGRAEELLVMSLRNVSTVHLLSADQLNTYDVLCSEEVVFTEAGYRAFIEPGGPEDGREAAASEAGNEEAGQ